MIRRSYCTTFSTRKSPRSAFTAKVPASGASASARTAVRSRFPMIATPSSQRLVGFDFKEHALKDLDRATLSWPLETWQGWRRRTGRCVSLKVIGPDGRSFLIALDENRIRRWWSWSFLPPGPNHARACVAVACDGGIVIHRLDDGARTRLFAGHESSVYCLAPSPDGRWLATGSSDQTVRLWNLSGCDQTPPLGAIFRRDPAGRWIVATITPRSFAEAMGFKVDDALEILAVNLRRIDPIANLESLDNQPPGIEIAFQVRRGADAVQIATTPTTRPHFPFSWVKTANGSSGCPRATTKLRSLAIKPISAGNGMARRSLSPPTTFPRTASNKSSADRQFSHD